MDDAELRARAARWMADDPDERTREELRVLLSHPDLGDTDLADRFAGPLEFGTAGLRAVLGAGPRRMNRAVVARATWGLVQALLESVEHAAERGIVVGADGRRMSRELAEDVASIAGSAGLRVVLFDEPVPTPLVGFAVKERRAAGGVVITASHNPPEYNGYKVYWDGGAQIAPPVDAQIAAAMARAPAARTIARTPLGELRRLGRLVDAPPDVTSAYRKAVRALAVHPDEGDRAGLSIVYTPLHGVGDALARAVLADAGFKHVVSVPEQQKPDGSFPTVAFPNPEEPGAMDLALALAARTRADLVLANDPDADRLAVAVPGDGRWRRLTGNEVGALLGHYLLAHGPAGACPRGAKEAGEARTAAALEALAAPRPRAVLASIVSSPLLGRIATSLGVHYEETLTGFKWIARRAMELERAGYEVVLCYEEALGYRVGNVVHDKDGISAAVVVAELAAVLRSRGRTLQDDLELMARRWGLFASTQVGVTRPGAAGIASLGQMMNGLRASPPAHIGGDEVVAVADYMTGRRTARATGEGSVLGLPNSNVLAFELASGSRVIARPSGTEPKAKFYVDVREEVTPGESWPEASARAAASAQRLAEAFTALASR